MHVHRIANGLLGNTHSINSIDINSENIVFAFLIFLQLFFEPVIPHTHVELYHVLQVICMRFPGVRLSLR